MSLSSWHSMNTSILQCIKYILLKAMNALNLFIYFYWLTQITCTPAYDCIGVNVMIWIEFEFILTLCTRISDNWDPVSDQNRRFLCLSFRCDRGESVWNWFWFWICWAPTHARNNFRQTHICLTWRTGLASVTWIHDDDVSKSACCVTPVIKPHWQYLWV